MSNRIPRKTLFGLNDAARLIRTKRITCKLGTAMIAGGLLVAGSVAAIAQQPAPWTPYNAPIQTGDQNLDNFLLQTRNNYQDLDQRTVDILRSESARILDLVSRVYHIETERLARQVENGYNRIDRIISGNAPNDGASNSAGQSANYAGSQATGYNAPAPGTAFANSGNPAPVAPNANTFQQFINSQSQQQIAANAYNPPANLAGQSTTAANVATGQAAPTARLVMDDNAPKPNSANPGNATSSNAGATQPAGQTTMPQDQFRADMNRIMQNFQQAAAQNQADIDRQRSQMQQASPPVNANTPSPAGGVQQPASSQNSQVYAPRNGYDQYGNRADSSRQQYDAQGYYVNSTPGTGSNGSTDFFSNTSQPVQAPVRQNRVYNWDGSSRPIGSGRSSAAQQYQVMQQWSNAQIARQQAGGYYSPPVSATPAFTNTPSYNAPAASTSTGGCQSGSCGPSAQLVFDDNAPRGNANWNAGTGNAPSATSSSQAAQPMMQIPSGPAIAPRQVGYRPQTASFSLPE